MISSFQSTWALVLKSYSTFSIEIAGTLLIQLLFFYIPVVCFSALSVYAPKFAHRHQLQPRESPPSQNDILKCFRVVASNQTMSLVFHVAMLGLLPHKPGYRFDEKLPSLREMVGNIVTCMLIREVSRTQSNVAYVPDIDRRTDTVLLRTPSTAPPHILLAHTQAPPPVYSPLCISCTVRTPNRAHGRQRGADISSSSSPSLSYTHLLGASGDRAVGDDMCTQRI